MKGNSALMTILACGSAVLGQAQQIQFGNGAILQGGFFVSAPARRPAPLPTVDPPGDVIEFVDGSLLHGQFQEADLNRGVGWENPDAKSPIHFHPDHIDFIRFAHADSMNIAPSCHLRFANGDDLFGSISSLDAERLTFNTWFGGAMTIPRAALRAITFLSKNYTILYEGPYDATGWIRNGTPQSWSYHDGWFSCNGPGTLARDLSLTNSSTVEFDIGWSHFLDLQVQLYTDVLDRMEYNNGSYILQFTPSQILLHQSRTIGPQHNFGIAPVPDLAGKNKIHVTIQCNKEESTVSVFINDRLLRVWKDDSGFTANGTGILFEESGAGGNFKLGNIKISQWEGNYEPDTTITATNTDSIHFINHDRAAGKITSIQNGKVTMTLGEMSLNIPLQRVTQINFATTNASVEPSGPWEVRAHFPGGGSLSFQLQTWGDKMISGKSEIFGDLAFQARAIREMEFNLNRPKDDNIAVATKEYEDLDE
jgi:hypothetical protein